MGKIKIAKKEEEKVTDAPLVTESKAEVKSTSKRKISSGVLYVESTFNNTKVSLTDEKGGVLMWSSSGSLGF